MKWYVFLSVFVLVGCNTPKKTSKVNAPEVNEETEAMAMPHQMVYKTKNNYSDKVPISLSDDKNSIVSFPNPKDLFNNGKLTLPIALPEGYYMDVRGIDKNVAFLNITYADYSKLSTIPSLEQLYALIEDKDPLSELWDCGIKTGLDKDKEQITQWILAGKLPEKAKRIK